MKNSLGIIRIAGSTKTHFYFQTCRAGELISTNKGLDNFTLSNYKITPNVVSSGFQYIVDSPKLIIYEKNSRSFSMNDLQQEKKPFTYHFPRSLCSRAVKISDSYIFRGFDTSVHTVDQIFFKANPNTNITYIENGISERLNDAGISTDGHLDYDTTFHMVTYTYFYKSELKGLDTNLNLLYKTNTIDNTPGYTITAGHFRENNKLKFTNIAPSKLINYLVRISEGKLFINSLIKASNEVADTFKKNNVIDIYDLRNGMYIKSLYIVRYKDEQLQDFSVIDGKLLALYPHYLILYSL